MKILRPIGMIVALYLLLKIGVPFIGSIIHPGSWPVIPTSVMKMFVFFIVVGVFLIYTYTDEGYAEVVDPITDLYFNPKNAMMRNVAMVAVGLLGAYVTYQYVKPTFDAPVELRSIHPAPPANAKMWGRSFNLQTLKNPLRDDKEAYDDHVTAGGEVYYQNCYFCHGDRLLGKGPFWDGFTPAPANFVDIGTIAQLTESYVFWRIGTGGPGLPSEGTPWLSAMPVWHEFISEKETWQVTMFIYDYTGHSPRVTTVHH